MNFEIVDSIALQQGNIYFDLHSNFDFVGFAYSISNRELTLEWKKSLGAWTETEKYKSIKLFFELVESFDVKRRDKYKPFSEDDCLSYIGFLSFEDIDTVEGFKPINSIIKNDDYLVLGFESGLILKILSGEVKLSIE